MPGGAFHPQAFDTSAFSPDAFSTQVEAHGALRGSFSSTFTSTPADLVLLVRQVAPKNTAHGSSNRPDARRRRFPSREALRKRTRRQADEDLLLSIL